MFAIAIVLTKQTMGVTVIIRVIISGSKVTVQWGGSSCPASDGLEIVL